VRRGRKKKNSLQSEDGRGWRFRRKKKEKES